jgi:Cu-Zn family superoxide dismutase
MRSFKTIAFLTLFFTLSTANAAALVVNMETVDASGQGKSIGTVSIESSKCGVLITPNLHDLTPGAHGFHIHQFPSCADKAMAAGGHLDPNKTQMHEGPYAAKGHQGDLPILNVDKDGNATLPSLAPNLTMSNFKGHALMIHMNGDNYSDTPEKLGGGGERIACGVISQ